MTKFFARWQYYWSSTVCSVIFDLLVTVVTIYQSMTQYLIEYRHARVQHINN